MSVRPNTGRPAASDLRSRAAIGRSVILEGAAASDRGHVRRRNEDAFLHDPERRLAAVADGLGGHVGGDVASRTALETVDEILGSERLSESEPADLLVEALRAANRRVRVRAGEDPALEGMGTTLVLAYLEPGGEGLTIAHVGDSRGYLLSGGRLRQLTEDHVRGGLLGRILVQAVGTQPDIDPGVARVPLEPGDRLLLCTDGLTDMLTDDHIATVLGRGDDDEVVCGALIDAALDQGGVDNVTVVVATITPQAGAASRPRAEATAR